MASKRYENWEAGDFARKFREAAHCATDDTFRAKFEGLADEVEPMGREFLRETAGCGRELGSVMEDMVAIAEHMKGCHREEERSQRCDRVYEEVDRAVRRVATLREGCFL